MVSPDGRRILSGSDDCMMIRWDRDRRQPIHRFPRHSGIVRGVAFSPDGRHAVWGGTDGLMRNYRLPATDDDKADHPAAPAPTASAKP